MPGLCREFRCSTPLPPQTCSHGRTVFFPLTRASASRSWTATCRTISVASNISCGIAPGPLRTRATLGDPRRRRPHHPRPLRAAPALWPPTGSARDGRENPRGPMRMASSNSRRLSSSTGSPISSRRRGSTGIGTTWCLPVRQWVISVPKRLRCFLTDRQSGRCPADVENHDLGSLPTQKKFW